MERENHSQAPTGALLVIEICGICDVETVVWCRASMNETVEAPQGGGRMKFKSDIVLGCSRLAVARRHSWVIDRGLTSMGTQLCRQKAQSM